MATPQALAAKASNYPCLHLNTACSNHRPSRKTIVRGAKRKPPVENTRPMSTRNPNIVTGS